MNLSEYPSVEEAVSALRDANEDVRSIRTPGRAQLINTAQAEAKRAVSKLGATDPQFQWWGSSGFVVRASFVDSGKIKSTYFTWEVNR